MGDSFHCGTENNSIKFFDEACDRNQRAEPDISSLPEMDRNQRAEPDISSLPEMAHILRSRAKRFIRSVSMDDRILINGSFPSHSLRISSVGQESYGSLNRQASASSREKKKWHWWELYWRLVTSKYINVLLLLLPFTQLSITLKWGDLITFIMSFMTMIPLASILGDLTEEVAEHLGQTMGGLISSSFGNAPELVFSIQALRANNVRVVQASLLGSILSNLLLVLGSSFFAGGLFSGKKEQFFNRVSAGANTSLLLMSSLALFLPCNIAHYNDAYDENALLISRFTALGMFFMYLQLMVFQFKTHTYVFRVPSDDGINEEDLEEHMSLSHALIGLGAVTALVAVFSEYLVGSMDGFTEATNLSTTFVGIILIPIIGNVVEHIVAVTVAVKDKMELSMGIAIGSACQVSLFVIPTCVLSGWAMDRDLTLNFPKFEVYIYLVVVLIVCHLIGNGSSNWLLGAMLITCYLMIAFAFWFEKVLEYST